MRFISLASVTVAAVVPVVYATAIDSAAAVYAKLSNDLTAKNFYGAPVPPWNHGKAGWYYGPNPGSSPGVPCLGGDVCNFLKQFPGALHCPPKYPPQNPPKYPPQSPPKYPPQSPPKYPPKNPPKYPPKPTYHTTTPKHTTTKPTTTKPTPTPTPTPTNGPYTPTFSNITAAVQADDYMTFGLVETVTDCEEMCDSVPGCVFVNTYRDVNGKDGSPLLTCSLFSKCHGAEDADNRGGQSQPDGTIDSIADSYGWCKTA